MSRANTPTLPWVLPMYEYMRKELDTHATNPCLPTNIREAIAAGISKLMEYYSLANKCQTNTLATSMFIFSALYQLLIMH